MKSTHATTGAHPTASADPVPHVARLLAEAPARRHPARWLAAAAHLDPEATARWLLANRGWAREALSPGELASVLASLFRLPPDPADLPTLAACALRYVDLLDPDDVLDFTDWRVHPGGIELIRALGARFPRHPGVLRAQVDLEIGRDAPAEQIHALLTRLGRASPSPATVRHVHRLRSRLGRVESETVRAAVLSSFTADLLVPYLDLECRALGLHPDILVAPFNTWEQQCVAPDSALYRFEPEVVFLAVSLDDLVPGLNTEHDASALATAGEGALNRVLSAVDALLARTRALVVVHGLYSVHPDPAGLLRGRTPGGQTEWVNQLNHRLREAFAERSRAYLLDLAGCLLRRADGPLEHPKLRHLGQIRLSDSGHAAVAREYAKYIAPLKGLTRKCVVVDLDNTLWGGVVGEDGPHGVRLGDTAPGSEYVELQHYLRSLCDRGFLLAIASKNNPEDALEVIRRHPAMVLREDTFVAMRINWQPKPENLRSIAAELSLGLDAMVFLDDNPLERAMMREHLPEVLTPELPDDPALYREFVQDLPQLQVLHLTDEDRVRGQQYRARIAREAARESSGALEEFLASLQIQVEISEADEASLPRIHQLFQRTNQFNLTTHRYGFEELRAYAASPAWRLYAARARDRYGDQGLVATALVELSLPAWRIDSLLLSCRVIGYGVETVLLAHVAEQAARAGAQLLEGEFRPTAKNEPASDFYARHGFTRTSATSFASRWRRQLTDGGIPAPPWIARVFP